LGQRVDTARALTHSLGETGLKAHWQASCKIVRQGCGKPYRFLPSAYEDANYAAMQHKEKQDVTWSRSLVTWCPSGRGRPFVPLPCHLALPHSGRDEPVAQEEGQHTPPPVRPLHLLLSSAAGRRCVGVAMAACEGCRHAIAPPSPMDLPDVRPLQSASGCAGSSARGSVRRNAVEPRDIDQ
jgi:hypothetical protein